MEGYGTGGGGVGGVHTLRRRSVPLLMFMLPLLPSGGGTTVNGPIVPEKFAEPDVLWPLNDCSVRQNGSTFRESWLPDEALA